jgi:hypothetical protein
MAKKPLKTREKLHPWRMCPRGEHWVMAHPLRVKKSKKNPDGITTRRGHCHSNPSNKDQLYPDEIHTMEESHFGRLRKLPTPKNLGSKDGNIFDKTIAGWTKYWNEVLGPESPLDSNLVKALISTESDFGVNKKALASKGNWARGLMQLTDQTIKILKDEKGELSDFLVNVDENKASDPSLNICAGIRWLFHKKKLLEGRLGRRASWEEAAMEYKSYTKGIQNGEKSALKQRDKFFERYRELKKD